MLCLVILTAVVYIELPGMRVRRHPRSIAASDMNAIAAALETYAHDLGEYPTQHQGLTALLRAPDSLPNPAAWLGPYLTTPLPVDPWGHQYIYGAPVTGAGGSTFTLKSLGADGVPGGSGAAADINFHP